MKKPPRVDETVIHQVPMAIQLTFRVPEPEDPAIQTWKLLEDSLPVFRTAMPLDVGFPAYDTIIVGVAVNPAVRLTVVQDTPVTLVWPYSILNGSRAAGSVPVVRLLALLAPSLLLALDALVAPVPPLATGTAVAMPAWNTR